MATAAGFDALPDARGLAAADFDRDGDVDFVVANYRAPFAYFENRMPRGKGLSVRLTGSQGNRDGVGAEVRVKVGERWRTKVVGAGHGYAGQYALEQLFGLGSAEAADAIEVRWPGGRVESYPGAPAGARLELLEGRAPTPSAAPRPPPDPDVNLPPRIILATLMTVAGISIFLVRRRRR